MMFPPVHHSPVQNFLKIQILAEYKCLKCGDEWEHRPRPTECPTCGHLYVEWVNYELMRKYWDDIEKTENKE